MGGDDRIERMAAADEDDLILDQAIERRKEPRGAFPGLKVELSGSKPAIYEAVEGGRRSFFVPEALPDRWQLGEVVDAKVSLRGRTAACKLEIFRKEMEPRRGMALRVVGVDPAAEEQLKAMFGE
jgi:hypothetical protein